MCGRFNMTADPLTRLFMALAGRELPDGDRWNVAPTEDVPVVRDADGRDVAVMRWWLVPHWSKEPSTKYAMFNARAESIERSNAFRGPFARRRCVVPISGFYEWRREGGRKLPHYVRPLDDDGLLLAGLWDRWEGEVDGEPGALESFTIVTTDVHEKLAFLHDRQPALLDRDAAEAWLDPQTPRERLKAMLVPSLPTTMEVVPVSTWVNNARHKDPRCVEPAGEPLRLEAEG